MVDALDAIPACAFDAVAMFALDTPGVKSAMDRLVERGTPVCTFVSDVPNSRRFVYIGQDNRVAGRTAARLLGLHAKGPGQLVVLTGSRSIRDQSERIAGFEEVLSNHFPDLDIFDIFEGRSDSSRNQAYLADLFASNSSIVGVHCVCGGRDGVISAVRALPEKRRPRVVLHELTSLSRDALADGSVCAIVHQNCTGIIEKSIEAMCRKSIGREWVGVEMQTEIFLAENIP